MFPILDCRRCWWVGGGLTQDVAPFRGQEIEQAFREAWQRLSIFKRVGKVAGMWGCSNNMISLKC